MRHLTELSEDANDAPSSGAAAARSTSGAERPSGMHAAVGTFEPVGREDGSEADTGMFRLFGRAVIADFRAATVGQYFALVLMVVVLAFEWGPGNEVVIVSTIAGVMEANPGWEGIPLVALTGFALVGGLQLFTGTVGLVGFAMFERTARAAWIGLNRLRKGAETADWWKLKLSTRWALAFLIGASAVGLIQMVTTGRTGWATHRRVIAQSALLAGLTTGAISATLAGAAFVARQYPATEGGAERLIAIASNPLTWIGLFAAIGVIGAIRSQFSSDEGSTGTDDPVD